MMGGVPIDSTFMLILLLQQIPTIVTQWSSWSGYGCQTLDGSSGSVYPYTRTCSGNNCPGPAYRLNYGCSISSTSAFGVFTGSSPNIFSTTYNIKLKANLRSTILKDFSIDVHGISSETYTNEADATIDQISIYTYTSAFSSSMINTGTAGDSSVITSYDGITKERGRNVGTSLNTASGIHHYFQFSMNYKPIISRSSNFHVSLIYSLRSSIRTNLPPGETHIVYQLRRTKNNIIPSATLSAEVDFTTEVIVGQTTILKAGIRSTGLHTEIEFRIYLPRVFTLENHRISPTYYDENMIIWTISERRNYISFKIPSFHGEINSELIRDFFVVVNGDAFTDTAEIFAYYVEVVSCSGYGGCSAGSNSFNFIKERRPSSKSYIHRRGSQFRNDDEVLLWRIKHEPSGKCFGLEDGVTELKVSPSCRQGFRYETNGAMVHIKTNKDLRILNGVVETTHSDPFQPIIGNHSSSMWYSRTSQLFQCVLVDDVLNLVKLSSEAGFSPSFSCDLNQDSFKYLPVYDEATMEKMGMRSLHFASTSLGSTIMTCQPAKDLGQVTNCMYSLDSGSKWKMIPSVVTHLNYFIPSEDSYYGWCHRALYNCKFNIGTGRVQYISNTDYSNGQLDVNMIATYKVDDLESLTKTPENWSENSNFGVSSLGLYRMHSPWLHILIWRN